MIEAAIGGLAFGGLMLLASRLKKAKKEVLKLEGTIAEIVNDDGTVNTQSPHDLQIKMLQDQVREVKNELVKVAFGEDPPLCGSLFWDLQVRPRRMLVKSIQKNIRTLKGKQAIYESKGANND